MRQIDRLRAVGRSAATALMDQETWIHRRVESITFPFPTAPVYRRQVSIDFTVPEGLQPASEELREGSTRPPRYYVPLSLVRRWPPLPRLDLRDETGNPIPFLTGRQNSLLDSSALKSVAVGISPKVEVDLQAAIAKIPGAEREDERMSALANVLSAPPESDDSEAAVAHRVLCENQIFCALARDLVVHTLLWLRVEAWPEDREVVKFSYDAPLHPRDTKPRWASSLGLEPFVFRFEVPHLGTTSSYHCNVISPSPLEVVRAQLALYEPPTHQDDKQKDLVGQVRHHVDSTRKRPESRDVELYVGVSDSQAKFYASGDRTGLEGSIWVAVLIQSQALLRGALGATLAGLAILLSFTILLKEITPITDAAVAVLLVAPAVLGYLLVRPSEGAWAGGFLDGLRRIVIFSGVPPVLAAAVLVLGGGNCPTLAVYAIFSALTVVEASLLVVTWLAYRAGQRWRKLFHPHSDAQLIPHSRTEPTLVLP